MEDLKQLLDLSALQSAQDIENRFSDLVATLFADYYIQKGTDRYDFVEVELYYYCLVHPDATTYPRNAKPGEWFFHDCGTDITFKSFYELDNNEKIKAESKFGGIFIRGLKKNDKNEYISGPIACMNTLFDNLNALACDAELYPLLKKSDHSRKVDIVKKRRWVKTSDPEGQLAKVSRRYSQQIDRETLETFMGEIKYRYYIKSEVANPNFRTARPWRDEF